jgi:hypothetical protein
MGDTKNAWQDLRNAQKTWVEHLKGRRNLVRQTGIEDKTEGWKKPQ